jgi:hypothetical protein
MPLSTRATSNQLKVTLSLAGLGLKTKLGIKFLGLAGKTAQTGPPKSDQTVPPVLELKKFMLTFGSRVGLSS